MLDLIYQMIWRMCMIVTIAFLITRLKLFSHMIFQRLSWKEKIIMIFVFGLFGIIGNYTAITIHPDISNFPFKNLNVNTESFVAIADTRNIGVIMGGLLGGPAVGIGAGIIAGGHRYLLGGFISVATFILTVLGGGIAGFINRKMDFSKRIKPSFILIIGVCILLIQIILIPVFSSSHDVALILIKQTGLPIIIVNGIGIWICSLIFYSVLIEEEKTKAIQTQKALFIANKTMPYFRQGLNQQSCEKVANILCTNTNADLVCITGSDGLLSHVGKGKKYIHLLQIGIQEECKQVLQTREMIILKSMSKVSEINPYCPLKAVLIVPLIVHEKPVGTLKLFYSKPNELTDAEQELAEGLMMMFSNQLELGEHNRQKELLQNAEIKALQAQIHPHFLFNSLNVIAALCKRDPLFARRLLIHLSTFLRNNINVTRKNLIPIEKEMESVNAYFSLVQARFPERFFLNITIHLGVETALIPPFTIQPLVENAIVHGFSEHCTKVKIDINIVKEKGFLKLLISDNGAGIPNDRLVILGKQVMSSNKGSGIAIFNIKERLSLVFGSAAVFSVTSQVNNGTVITIEVPYQQERKEQQDDQSLLG